MNKEGLSGGLLERLNKSKRGARRKMVERLKLAAICYGERGVT
jgi:hypothetical protein